MHKRRRRALVWVRCCEHIAWHAMEQIYMHVAEHLMLSCFFLLSRCALVNQKISATWGTFGRPVNEQQDHLQLLCKRG
jgi:hypothetical protein